MHSYYCLSQHCSVKEVGQTHYVCAPPLHQEGMEPKETQQVETPVAKETLRSSDVATALTSGIFNNSDFEELSSVVRKNVEDGYDEKA